MRTWLPTLSLLALVACSDQEGTPEGDTQDASIVAAATIGPEGGVVTGTAVSLEIPANALPDDVRIEIATTNESLPSGYLSASSIFRFTPEGLLFADPVTVRFTDLGDTSGLALLWSKADGSGYEMMAGTAASGTFTATVDHFSQGVLIIVPGSVCPGAGDVDCGAAGLCCIAQVCSDCDTDPRDVGPEPDGGTGACQDLVGDYAADAQGLHTCSCAPTEETAVLVSFTFSILANCEVTVTAPQGETWGVAVGTVSSSGAITWSAEPAGACSRASFSGTVAGVSASGEWSLPGTCGGCDPGGTCSGGGSWSAQRQ